MSDTKLAWLAGIVDGEGCIYTKNRINRPATVHACLQIVNTSLVMIEEIEKIYDSLGVAYSKSKERCDKGGVRTYQKLYVSRKNDLKLLLELLLPFLVNKRPEAERILLYLNESCKSTKYSCPKEDTVVKDLVFLKSIA